MYPIKLQGTKFKKKKKILKLEEKQFSYNQVSLRTRMDFLSETIQAEKRVKYLICWKKKMKKLRIVYTTNYPSKANEK